MIKFIFGLILIGSGFLMAIFRDPIWGLYLFAALSHIRLEQLGENYSLPLNVPIVIACVTLFLYSISTKYPRPYKWPAEIWLFGLMVLGMFIGSARAQFDPALSWTLTFDYFKYWVFLILFVQMVDSAKKVELFYWVLILSSVWLVYRCWDLRGSTGPRFENLGGGNIADANHFAAALVMLFPFACHKVFSRDRRIAIGAVVLCFGIVMSIVISGSRSGFLGLGALFVLFALTIRRQRWKLLATVIGIGFVALPFLNEYQIDRFWTIFAEGESRDASSQLRLEFWKLAFRLFTENPVLGISPGEFKYYAGYMVEGRTYGTPGHVTHSLWFEMLSRGLIVFLPFVLMLVRCFLRSSRLARHYREAGEHEMAMTVQIPMIALGAFLVPATFLDRSVYEPIYWCMGLVIVHRYLFEERTRTAVDGRGETYRNEELTREA